MKIQVLLVLVMAFLLSGCETLIVAGAATGAVASNDRRTVPTQLEDQNIELKSFNAIFENDVLWKDTNISVVSFNNTVLMIGQAPTVQLKTLAETEIKKIEKVKQVLNQIRIAAPTSFIARRNDDFITTKVKSSMLFTSDFPSSKIKVVTENSEVFLMGLVTPTEAEKAVEIARNISGVTQVIKAFELVDIKP